MNYEEFSLLGEAIKQRTEPEFSGCETIIRDVRAIDRTRRNRERLSRGGYRHNAAHTRCDRQPIPDPGA